MNVDQASKRHWLPWVLVVVLTAIAVLAAGLGLKSSGVAEAKAEPLSVLASAPPTGFGGYSVEGSVHSIAAQWQVPRVLDTSKSGWAATWIGAQSPTGAESFIQLGTIEESSAYPGFGSEFQEPPGMSRYTVFWSDTKHLFQPVTLGSVAAGSTVTASMTLSSSGWQLSMKVGSRWFARDFVVPSSVGATFDRAEWIQEDPPVARIASSDTPYPKLSTVTFRHMALNGHVPDLPYSDAQAISTGSGTFEKPTSVSRGSFTLVPVTGVSAVQYLRDATVFDASVSAFDLDWSNWQNESPPNRIRGVEVLIKALNTFVAKFQSQSWPAASQDAVIALVNATQRQVNYLTGWVSIGDTTDRPNLSGDAGTTRYADQVRASLGLPQA